MSSRNYLPQLDGLRALAVAGVLLTHYLPRPGDWPLGVYWGGLGVRLFFVLSGFLITGILLRESAGADRQPGARGFLLRHFYLRRILRLAPVYYLTLVLMYACDAPATRETFWWHFFYLSNVKFALTGNWQGYVAHFWSLAVEEQFYLVWPLALLFVPRRRLVLVAATLIPAAIVYRGVAGTAGLSEVTVAVLPPNSMDALLVGALLALGVEQGWMTANQGPWTWLAWGGLAVWGASEFGGFASRLLGCASETGMALFFGWVVLRAAEGSTGLPWRLLQNRVLCHLGKISYGIYVVHNLVGFLFFSRLRLLFSATPPRLAAIATALMLTAGSVAFAALSWQWLEKPINRYRQSLAYRRSDA